MDSRSDRSEQGAQSRMGGREGAGRGADGIDARQRDRVSQGGAMDFFDCVGALSDLSEDTQGGREDREDSRDVRFAGRGGSADGESRASVWAGASAGRI